MKKKWYIENLNKNEIHSHRVRKFIAKVKTPFQTAEIVDTYDYGISLFLDGLIQSTELDEFIYHEALIHPALILHPSAEKIFIAGGGEGAPLREILKHPSILRVVMVEIDEEVVKLSKKYLLKWHNGAFDSPKVSLYYEDARKFLENTNDIYDCIFLDLCDPTERGPAQKLFTIEFYNLIKNKISKDGLAIIQAGSANLNMAKGFCRVYKNLKEVFFEVVPYQACVHSFVGPWAFFLASNTELKDYKNLKLITKRFKERNINEKLKFYSPEVHLSLFALPPYFKDLLFLSAREQK